MSIDIDVSHNFFQIEKFFADFNKKQNVPALKRAVNRAAISVRKEGIIQIRKHLKLKVSDVRKRTRVSKSRAGISGTRFKTVESRVYFSGNPIPLLAFVTGSKQPRDQKGIAVSRRKGIKVQIKPGRKIKLRHAFIADVQSKQVFKRSGTGKSPLKKQGVPSIGTVVNSTKRRIRPRLQAVAQSRFNTVFVQEINARLDKATRRPRFRKA